MRRGSREETTENVDTLYRHLSDYVQQNRCERYAWDRKPKSIWNKPANMKLNENTLVIGERIILIPYKKIHVSKYHSWMQSEDMLRLTASERLTLEKEYEMQESWHEDDDKLTFLVADKEAWNGYSGKFN